MSEPDFVGEIARLNERLYKHEQERLNHEAMFQTQAARLSKLEKRIDELADALLKIAELRNRTAKA